MPESNVILIGLSCEFFHGYNTDLERKGNNDLIRVQPDPASFRAVSAVRRENSLN